MTLKHLALILTFTASFVAVSPAQTPEQRQACMDDAFKFCGHAIPDRDRVFACLVQNSRVISPICRGAVAPHVAQEPSARPTAKGKTKAKAKKTKSKTAKRAPKGPINLAPSAR